MSMLGGKVVVIVGGAGLLGRRFCMASAAEGARVVVADRSLEAAEAVVRDIVAHGHHAEAAPVDITDTASVDALIASVQQRHGRIDSVVVSAYPRNPQYGRRLEQVTYADFCENLGLHLGGYFLVAQRFGLHFQQQGGSGAGGSIVLLGSIYGSMAPRFEVYEGTPMTMPVEYAAIKGGIVQLVRYLAQWFKPAGVRVNCLSPGGILDKQPDSFLAAYKAHTAGTGMLSPDDISGALLFLLSDAGRHVTGQNLIVDDGFSL
ncbi:oxidoreductase [Uliginosibacterium sp. H1]|uniref:oxidoreductase n=1 Tax=Uliginosibacterium sp. H1 TaxID=3114757 RepID=UPI002E1948F9|nr:oxidoreductase [Uliginosibacterium sp. H1]